MVLGCIHPRCLGALVGARRARLGSGLLRNGWPGGIGAAGGLLDRECAQTRKRNDGGGNKRRSHGIPPANRQLIRIATRHVLRNALIPLLTILLPIFPGMMTGTIFVESLFRIPGLGSWFVTSSFKRDYPMILGITILWAALISVTYLVTDILYAVVDPRVRLEEVRR